MRGRVPMAGMAGLVAAGALALAGLSAQPVEAAQAGVAAVAAVGPQRIDRFNVGSPHSPQVQSELAGRTGAAAPATSTTAPAGVQGVDVASFQHPGGAAIDWASVAGAGIKFAAVKLTEGNYYVNPYAGGGNGDLRQAQAAGLAVMGYAFAIPNLTGPDSSAAAQADFALYHAYYSSGRVPVALDIEYDPYVAQDHTDTCYGLSPSAMVSWIKAFVTEVHKRTGQPPVIYTAQPWWKECTGNSADFGSDPLWLVDVNSTNTPPAGTALPAGWSDWTIWQWGQTGSVTGIQSSTVDRDVLNQDQLTVLTDGAQQYKPSASINAVQLQASIAGASYTPKSVPTGITVDSSGVVSGTAPGTAGVYPVTVTATAGPSTADITFDLDVHGTDRVHSHATQYTVAGHAVLLRNHTSDSVAGTTQLYSASGLPDGLSIDRAGRILGWPSRAGTYQVTVTARDNLGASGHTSFTWTVTPAADSGVSGHVRLDIGGKCLKDVGNRSANGTQAEIWRCNRSHAEHWTYVPDGTLRIHGKCLTSPSRLGWAVRLEPCSGAATRQWLLVYPRSVNPRASSRPIGLVNTGTGWCLSDTGWKTANGTRVIIRSCSGKRNEEWAMRPGQIESQIPGRCMADYRNHTRNGTPIILHTCRSTAAQRWKVKPDGTVRVHGKCLEVHRGATYKGARADLWRCNGTGAQQWRLVSDGPGVDLLNPRSGLCLADPGNSTRNGTRLRITTCGATIGGRWRFG